MEVVHSLPSLDISPLHDYCFAEMPQLKIPDNFYQDAMELIPNLDWYTARLNHREYGETPNRPDQKIRKANPFNIDSKTVDEKIITRQLRSTLKNQNGLAIVGNIHSGENKFLDDIKTMLGDAADIFTSVLMFSFETDESLIPHKDGGGGCRLYIPVHPVGMDYSRLELYYNSHIYYVYHLENPAKVYLFSQEVPHAVFNHGYPKRYNLQITSKLPYKETLAALESLSK